MARAINDKVDALFVEGPDDGAFVNAFMSRAEGIDLARHPHRLVRANAEGGGDSWALREFEKYLTTARAEARVGVIVDRDDSSNDKWPAVRELLRRIGGEVGDGPVAGGVIIQGRYGVWMWPDNVSHGDLETLVASILPQSAVFSYATEACRVAKDDHGAEYEPRHGRRRPLVPVRKDILQVSFALIAPR